AATPVGLTVTATAEVTKVDGRTITFRVEARDDREVIGDGTHERVVVNVARFDDRVQRKVHGRAGLAGGRPLNERLGCSGSHCQDAGRLVLEALKAQFRGVVQSPLALATRGDYLSR